MDTINGFVNCITEISTVLSLLTESDRFKIGEPVLVAVRLHIRNISSPLSSSATARERKGNAGERSFNHGVMNQKPVL